MDKAKLIDPELRNFIAATFNYHLDRKTIKGRKHLCFDCPVDTNKCPKTMDDPYLNIEDYHFILDGEEVTHYETACTEVEEEGVTPSAYSTTDDEKFKRVDKVEKIDTYQVYRCKKYDYAKKQQKLRRKNRP